MADRTSADVFCKIFTILARNPTEEHRQMAMEFYDLTGYYDFNPYQMYADEALLALGVARMGVDPRYPEDGETVLYPEDEGWEDAQPGVGP